MSKPRKTARRYADRLSELEPGREVRVAVYLRISTDEEHQPFSLDAQEHRLRAFIESQPGWCLARQPYVDQISGAKIERPGLQKALRDAALGLYDVLLVYRVDRFARKLSVLVDLLEQLEKCGVAFRSATEPIDTSTATGRMLVQLLGVFAEFERETIIDRVINGMERKAARGEWTAGQYPFGYTVPERRKGDDTPNYLVVDELHAPLVPIIFAKYARDRVGANTIAAWLNDNGHRTRRGALWSNKSVLEVLRNRAYLGEVYFRGNWHIAPHPPLIAPGLFAEAQAILAKRGDGHAPRTADGSDYLLSGLVKCAKCGHHFTGTAAQGRSERYRYYTCFGRQRYGNKKCDADRLRADDLEAAVLDSLLRTYRRGDLFDQAVRAVAARVADDRGERAAELGTLADKIAKAQASIDRYLRAFEDGTMPEAQCGARVRELSQQLLDLRARHDELTEAIEASSAVAPSAEVLAELRNRIADAIECGTPAEQKALVQALVAEVAVTSRDHVEPFFRVPGDTGAEAVRAVGSYVGEGGLEPPRPCGHRNLNPARLPIPPLARAAAGEGSRSRPPPGRPFPPLTQLRQRAQLLSLFSQLRRRAAPRPRRGVGNRPVGKVSPAWDSRASSGDLNAWSRACSPRPSAAASPLWRWAAGSRARWTSSAQRTCAACSCPTSSRSPCRPPTASGSSRSRPPSCASWARRPGSTPAARGTTSSGRSRSGWRRTTA
jgi:site-specific DNA recombinase